jgi:hypothetical protein
MGIFPYRINKVSIQEALDRMVPCQGKDVGQYGPRVIHIKFPEIMNVLDHSEYCFTIVEYQLMSVTFHVHAPCSIQDGRDRSTWTEPCTNFIH